LGWGGLGGAAVPNQVEWGPGGGGPGDVGPSESRHGRGLPGA
jgi:hypothetical protein